MLNPRVEILLATFNGRKYIFDFIKSIHEQSYDNCELLISDDNSTDGTLEYSIEVCREFDIKFVNVSSGIGFRCSKLNFEHLLKKSTANYVMLADQDDFWKPSKVKNTFDLLKKIENSNVDLPCLVFTDLEVVDENLVQLKPSMLTSQKLDPKNINNVKDILCQNVIAGCTMMLNRKVIEAVLPFTNVDLVHDHWIAATVASKGKISFLDEQTIKYRQHSLNQIGFEDVGVKYLVKKIPKIIQSINLAHLASKELGVNFSFLSLLINKLKLNLKRLVM